MVLQLTNIHGDVSMLLPLDSGKAPVALDTDEYGIPRTGQQPTRYGWLGGEMRSSESVSGAMLMGARMYSPATGRFLTSDLVYGGSATAYDYANQDPGNQFDPSGRAAYVRKCGTSWKWYAYKFSCTFYVTRFHSKMLKEDVGTMGGAGAAIAEAYLCSRLIHSVAVGVCTALAWAYTLSVHHVNSAAEGGGCFTWKMGPPLAGGSGGGVDRRPHDGRGTACLRIRGRRGCRRHADPAAHQGGAVDPRVSGDVHGLRPPQAP